MVESKVKLTKWGDDFVKINKNPMEKEIMIKETFTSLLYLPQGGLRHAFLSNFNWE